MRMSYSDEERADQDRAVLYARIKELENQLDSLRMQAIDGIVPGWVSIPSVEWMSIMVQES